MQILPPRFESGRRLQQCAPRGPDSDGNFTAALKQELSQTVFNHPKIGELKHKLIGFATINDVRGNHKKRRVRRTGWAGWSAVVVDFQL